ncbi:MAG: hypothetical protein ACTHMQ_12480 [Protaetiibacter sp.]
MDENRTPDSDEPEVITDEEWSDENPAPGDGGTAGPDDDDPQGMRGQLDDSMDGLEPGDDAGEAARGIPQNAETDDDADAGGGS